MMTMQRIPITGIIQELRKHCCDAMPCMCNRKARKACCQKLTIRHVTYHISAVHHGTNQPTIRPEAMSAVIFEGEESQSNGSLFSCYLCAMARPVKLEKRPPTITFIATRPFIYGLLFIFSDDDDDTLLSTFTDTSLAIARHVVNLRNTIILFIFH